MNTHHSVAWLDHDEARVFKFVGEQVEEIDVHAENKRTHIHSKRSVSGRHETNTPYLHEVAHALGDTNEILIVGPGSAKLELVKHLHAHHAEMVPRIIGVETVDHPTDGQLVAYARKYFVKADRMR